MSEFFSGRSGLLIEKFAQESQPGQTASWQAGSHRRFRRRRDATHSGLIHFVFVHPA
jgi:hypothetical protein